MNSKECKQCKQTHKLEQFYTCKSNSDGRHNICKMCWLIRKNANRTKSNEAHKIEQKKLEENRTIENLIDGKCPDWEDELNEYYSKHPIEQAELDRIYKLAIEDKK